MDITNNLNPKQKRAVFKRLIKWSVAIMVVIVLVGFFLYYFGNVSGSACWKEFKYHVKGNKNQEIAWIDIGQTGFYEPYDYLEVSADGRVVLTEESWVKEGMGGYSIFTGYPRIGYIDKAIARKYLDLSKNFKSQEKRLVHTSSCQVSPSFNLYYLKGSKIIEYARGFESIADLSISFKNALDDVLNETKKLTKDLNVSYYVNANRREKEALNMPWSKNYGQATLSDADLNRLPASKSVMGYPGRLAFVENKEEQGLILGYSEKAENKDKDTFGFWAFPLDGSYYIVDVVKIPAGDCRCHDKNTLECLPENSCLDI